MSEQESNEPENPDEPDPNLITTHSFGESQSPVEENEQEQQGE